MESRSTTSRLRKGPARALPAALFLIAALTAAHAQSETRAMTEPRFIEVAGEASVEAAPDFARVTLGVTTTGKDAREALAANASAVAAVVELVKKQGVAPADIQTSSLSISPMMSNPKDNSLDRRTVVGYSVANMLTVTARDLGKLGPLIDSAVGAGANALYGLSYGENDPGALLDAARPRAVEDAKRKADLFAAAAGAKVGRLLSLFESGGAGPTPNARFSAPMAAGAPATPIEPGRNRLTASVTARFELVD